MRENSLVILDRNARFKMIQGRQPTTDFTSFIKIRRKINLIGAMLKFQWYQCEYPDLHGDKREE